MTARHRLRQGPEDRNQPVQARLGQDLADRRASRGDPQLPAAGIRVSQRHHQGAHGVPVTVLLGGQVRDDHRVVPGDGREGGPELLRVPGVNLGQRGHDGQPILRPDPDAVLAGAVGQRLTLSARQARLAVVSGAA